HPARQRDDARLMIIDRSSQKISHDIFRNIGQYLPQQSFLVVNNSKVVPARLLGRRKNSGGQVEVFLLKQLGSNRYEALLKPLKKIKVGEPLEFDDGVLGVLEDKERRIVCFNKKNMAPFLDKIGHIPLPPYISRPDQKSDKSEYQTVYARHRGSVASPTAGLHFTKPLIEQLKKDGHTFSAVTLHINYGTFKPVECEDVTNHPMHSEDYYLSQLVYRRIINARQSKRAVVAVGTTSCRVLESVSQTGKMNGSTNIFIYPGYQFQLIDCLLTNFHLPKSTLLMLVSAFGGMNLIKRAYQQAITMKYRFYSYGDAMLII
ncbi:MAG: tRNA preQ1(34) S-adenosylmethionine ribosyltransferase-isomerase QueA, partial [Candidatus Omnitrophica bacterium]|nr:tRNA preQ1(34) S-adenosylmethionine ribosyltransferase-isomerase QueA [Candidatus Omnitrophota bacterium]